jgi:hypothetical protein
MIAEIKNWVNYEKNNFHSIGFVINLWFGFLPKCSRTKSG